MKKIFIAGAGTMGLDIAQVFAVNGYDVVLRDINDGLLQASKSKLENSLLKFVEKGKMDAGAMADTLSRITYTTELKAASGCDLVLEVIIENMEIKKSFFKEVDAICGPETIFASNTSAMSITEIANATKRADRFIGMHFFNPATIMKLVELTRCVNTTDKTYKTVCDLTASIGKEPVSVLESPGFIVNRILVPMINEAIFLYSEGIASAEDIDKAMVLGANHPMGPLKLCDLVGLDVTLFVMETLYSETSDSKYRPAPLLKKMVRGGLLGKKAGKGFYHY